MQLSTYLIALALGSPFMVSVAAKSVFAHFMRILTRKKIGYQVCPWITQSQDDFDQVCIQDIQLAASKGIDAFALNVGRDGWQIDRVNDAYSAALELGNDFKLFLSLDMTSLYCNSEGDMEVVQRFVFTHATHSAQMKYSGLPLVSTFSGERCTFGQGDSNSGWIATLKTPSYVRNYLYTSVYFMPAFFVDPKDFPWFTCMDGIFNWNSGWPAGNTDISYNSDQDWISMLGGRSYMPAVSPWFFTHYGPNTYNKNFIFRGDNWLLPTRWEILTSHRNDFEIVQIISWNDFGESHYLSYKGEKPNCQSWTDGFDHLGWLDLIEFYVSAFKQGQSPIPTRDRLFLWGRLYPTNAECGDGVGKPMNWQYTEDTLWVVAAAVADADITITCGPSQSTKTVSAGLSKLSIPLREDCQVQAHVIRGGQTVLSTQPERFVFSSKPNTYNYNAFVYATP